MATQTLTVTNASDRGAGSLRAAITAARPGAVIQFAAGLRNQTIALSGGALVVSAGKRLTIDGGSNNVTISGNNASRIFNVESTGVQPTLLTLRNLTLTRGRTPDRGGAINAEFRSTLRVENVAFTNNVADKGGGAINVNFEGTLTVTGSRFTGNQAIAGNDERGAGAIAFSSPRALTVSNSQFVNNQGINGGAINSLNGKLTITNSQFRNNSTLSARFDTGKERPELRGYGGALYTDRASGLEEASGSIVIRGSNFEGNQGRAEGGAAYLFTGTQDRITIDSSNFRNNAVQALAGGNGGNGGGLVVLSNGQNRGLTLSRTSFVGNSATGQGGGLWTFDTPSTITNCTFATNQVTGSSFSNVGGGMALYSPTAITNSTIANNRAGWVGGGISAVNEANVTVRNTIFANNTAANGGNPWQIQQQTNRLLNNGGGNIQFPNLTSDAGNRPNDTLATAGIRVVNPRLGGLTTRGTVFTYALLAGSPAINTGVSAGAPPIDGRGFVRRDGRVDVGAFEFGATGTARSRLQSLDRSDGLLGARANGDAQPAVQSIAAQSLASSWDEQTPADVQRRPIGIGPSQPLARQVGLSSLILPSVQLGVAGSIDPGANPFGGSASGLGAG